MSSIDCVCIRNEYKLYICCVWIYSGYMCLCFYFSSFLCRSANVGAYPLWTSVSACSCNNLFVPLNLHFQVLQWGHSTRSARHSGEPPGRKKGGSGHTVTACGYKPASVFSPVCACGFIQYTFERLAVWESQLRFSCATFCFFQKNVCRQPANLCDVTQGTDTSHGMGGCKIKG